MSAWTVAASAPASAVPGSSDQVVSGVKDLGGGAQYNLRRGVFVAKDLGGGAYWLTTSKAVDTVITATESGREAILIVNDTVIRPVQDATGL
jgi:hypothetical protein